MPAVAPVAPSAPTPVATQVPAAAPAPAPGFERPKTIQLKNVFSGSATPQAPQGSAQQHATASADEVTEALEFTHEQLLAACELLSGTLPDHKTRLKHAILQASKQVKDNHIICLEVANELHHGELNSEKVFLTSFLQKQLRNKNVALELNVEAANAKSTKPYTPEQRFQYLAEKNPALVKFKQDLHLDYS